MRIELTREMWCAVRKIFVTHGAKLRVGVHEGSTLILDNAMVCSSDGVYWLHLERVPAHCVICGTHGEVSPGGACSACVASIEEEEREMREIEGAHE